MFVEEHTLSLTLIVCVLDDEGHGMGEGPGLLTKFRCRTHTEPPGIVGELVLGKYKERLLNTNFTVFAELGRS